MELGSGVGVGTASGSCGVADLDFTCSGRGSQITILLSSLQETRFVRTHLG